MKFNLKRAASIAGLKLKKNAPTIMTVAGCAGVVVSVVLACKETLELEDTLESCKEKTRDIELAHAKFEEYDDNEFKKDMAIQTVKNAATVAKLYAPSVTLCGASIGLILSSNGIMKKRNANLAAAYATLDAMYKTYRKNVVDTFGADIDHDLRYGIRHEKVDAVVVDEKGKEHKVKQTVDVITNPLEGISDYSRFWEEGMRGWDPDPTYRISYLKGIQQYCQDRLVANGYLFLNDVYEELGIPKTKAGQCVGWIYDKNNPVGDNYIDFGLYNEKIGATRRFINGEEDVILLDFNVDGDILNSPLLKLWN